MFMGLERSGRIPVMSEGLFHVWQSVKSIRTPLVLVSL